MSIVFYTGPQDLTSSILSNTFLQIVLPELGKKYSVYILSSVETENPFPNCSLITKEQYEKKWFDALVVVRYADFFYKYQSRAKKILYWAHDSVLIRENGTFFTPDEMRAFYENVKYSGIIASMGYHSCSLKRLSRCESLHNVYIIPFGSCLNVQNLEKIIPLKEPFSYVYSMGYEGGVDEALKKFDLIREKFPANLYIYGDVEEKVKKAYDKPYIHFFPTILTQEKYIEVYSRMEFCLYIVREANTYHQELYIAQACGCVPIIQNTHYLNEQIGSGAIFMEGDYDGKEENTFMEAVEGAVENKEIFRERGIEWIRTFLAPSNIMKMWERYLDVGQLIPMISNFSNTLSLDWKKMIPKDYPYRPIDREGENETIVFNFAYRSPKKEDIKLTMEPKCNREWFPKEWEEIPSVLKRNMIEWHVSLNFDAKLPNKTKVLSAIISGARSLEGHAKRLNLIYYLCDRIEFDLFGKHKHNSVNYRGPLVSKDDGLYEYFYHISCENCSEPDYFTEKITDAILAETCCFYWGCQNIEEYIDPRAYILLDIDDHEKSFNIIVKSIKNNEYQKRLPYIQNEKRRLMYGWSIFPTLKRLKERGERSYTCFVLNLDHRMDRWVNVTENLYGVNYTRFSASNGKDLSEVEKSLLKNKTKQNRHPKGIIMLKTGEFGCAISHYRMWNKFLTEKKSDLCLILEDDIIPMPDFLPRLCSVYSLLEKKENWDLCYLGLIDDQNVYREILWHSLPSIEIVQFSKQQNRCYGGGTMGYVISRKGAEKLIGLVKEKGMIQPVDWFLVEQYPYITALKCMPHLITYDTDNDTDVQKSEMVIPEL